MPQYLFRRTTSTSSKVEGDAPLANTPGKTKELKEPQWAPSLNQKPRGKAQMSLMDQEVEREETDVQLALHLSRVEAQKGLEGTHLSQPLEAAEGTRSLPARRSIAPAYGVMTRRPPPPPDSPDIIPDSEPTTSTSASEEVTGSNEEDLASVRSTVQIGSPGSFGKEGNASPVRSHRGTWRNSDGS